MCVCIFKEVFILSLSGGTLSVNRRKFMTSEFPHKLNEVRLYIDVLERREREKERGDYLFLFSFIKEWLRLLTGMSTLSTGCYLFKVPLLYV